jgi:hypothetical protein
MGAFFFTNGVHPLFNAALLFALPPLTHSILNGVPPASVFPVDSIILIASGGSLCTGALLAVGPSSAAVLTSPYCFSSPLPPPATAAWSTTPATLPLPPRVFAARGGPAAATGLGFFTLLAYVLAEGVDGGALAVALLVLNATGVASIGGLGAPLPWAAAAPATGVPAEALPGDALTALGFGPGAAARDAFGAPTVGVGAGVLRAGAVVVGALGTGEAPVCGAVLRGGALLGAPPMAGGAAAVCCGAGSGWGDEGAPLLALDGPDGGARIVGVAVGASGGGSEALCGGAAAAPRFTSTAFRAGWVLGAVEALLSGGGALPTGAYAPSCPPSASPTPSATPSRSRSARATRTPSATRSPSPSRILAALPEPLLTPLNWLAIGLSAAALCCVAGCALAYGEYVRLRVRAASAPPPPPREARGGAQWAGRGTRECARAPSAAEAAECDGDAAWLLRAALPLPRPPRGGVALEARSGYRAAPRRGAAAWRARVIAAAARSAAAALGGRRSRVAALERSAPPPRPFCAEGPALPPPAVAPLGSVVPRAPLPPALCLAASALAAGRFGDAAAVAAAAARCGAPNARVGGAEGGDAWEREALGGASRRIRWLLPPPPAPPRVGYFDARPTPPGGVTETAADRLRATMRRLSPRGVVAALRPPQKQVCGREV